MTFLGHTVGLLQKAVSGSSFAVQIIAFGGRGLLLFWICRLKPETAKLFVLQGPESSLS